MIVFRSAVLVIFGPIAVRKHAAAPFRREKFILLQVCLTGGHLVIIIIIIIIIIILLLLIARKLTLEYDQMRVTSRIPKNYKRKML